MIGHELTHGFDDQGRQFDADGNLRDWWTSQDNDEFKKREKCIEDEYSGFSPADGVHLNGKLTLGENGADNAGVRLAYMALMQSVEEGGASKEKLDGFTPQQRFFLGYAQIWCQNERAEALKAAVRVDPHSSRSEFRVDGVVENSPGICFRLSLFSRSTYGFGECLPGLVIILRLILVVLFGALLSTYALAQSQSGLDLSAIDKSIDPCTDFYQYACGGWLKANPIPPDEASWGRFDVLFENNQKTLRSILEDSQAHQTSSANDQQVGGFYQSCMGEDVIEKLAATPLRGELDRIAAIKTRADLLAEIARLHDRQVPVFFSFSSEPDPDDARRNIADLDQGGLGLPEKDFYFRTDSNSEEIRRKYVTHISKMLELSGVEQAAAHTQAEDIMRMETALAKGSLDVTLRRDPKLLVHRTSLAELAAESPSFSFDDYFRAIRAPKFETLNVAVPGFDKALNDLFANEPMANLQHYLVWHYISASSRLLSHAFVDENFEFYSRTLTGTSQLRPRWKRCVSATDDELGEALGRLFRGKNPCGVGQSADAANRNGHRRADEARHYRDDLDEPRYQEAGARQIGVGNAKDRLSRSLARLFFHSDRQQRLFRQLVPGE